MSQKHISDTTLYYCVVRQNICHSTPNKTKHMRKILFRRYHLYNLLLSFDQVIKNSWKFLRTDSKLRNGFKSSKNNN